MGLDISAYSKVRVVKNHALSSDEEVESVWNGQNRMLYVQSFWADRALPFKNQDEVTSTGEYGSMRAGSYSGYNSWRNTLCQTINGVSSDFLYDNEEKFIGTPFYELINFSDAEGTLGTEVAKKLLNDFETHLPKMIEVHGLDSYFVNKYQEWIDMFKLASDDGVVIFH